MPYVITPCYLPPGRGDIPGAFTPAEAGTRFSGVPQIDVETPNYSPTNILPEVGYLLGITIDI